MLSVTSMHLFMLSERPFSASKAPVTYLADLFIDWYLWKVIHHLEKVK